MQFFRSEVTGIEIPARGAAPILTITLVPEPSTALLLASGLVAMAVGRRRRAL